MDLKKFEKLLKSHDWFYQYSDDSKYYRAGRESAAKINYILQKNKDNPEYQELYNKMQPK